MGFWYDVRIGRKLRMKRLPRVRQGTTHKFRAVVIKTIVLLLVLTECSTLLVVFMPKTANAAALTVASSTSETQQTTSSTTYTASDATIASGSLPAGTYFVAWGAAVANSGLNDVSNARLVRGSTEIAALGHESMAGTAANQGIARSGYWLGTLSGSEALTIQYNSSSAISTAYIDSKFIKAIRLDTNLTADTDYFTSGSQESATDEVANAATGSWTDVKTLTKTFSSFDTEEYLVFASMEISPDSTSNDCSGRLEVDGSAIMTSTLEGEDTTDQQTYAVAKISSVGTGSKSIKLQGQSVGTATCDYRRSRVYVFRATVFDQAVESYSAAESTLASATWTDKNSQSYTPNQSETVMVIGSRIQGASGASCPIATRLDDGTTQYADTHAFVANNTGADYAIGMSAASLSVSSAKTFKTQFQRVASTCTVKIKESTLIVWSMTLRDPAAYNQSAYRWFDDTTGSGSGWWSNTWLNRRKITFNNSQSTENLTNFPVRVSLTSSNIDYSKTQNAGQDIRFIDADGTVLKHEIEKWDEAGTSEVWVKVPQIDSGSTTDYVWIYYNNTLATDAQDPTNVWDSNTKGVWHMKEDPTPAGSPNGCDGATKEICDSTANNNDADSNGSMTSADQVAGQINGSVDFDGTNDNFNAADSSSLDITGTITISGWVRTTSSAGAYKTVVMKEDTSSASNYALQLDTGNLLDFNFFAGGSYRESVSNTALSTNTWYHVAATYSDAANEVKLYINGALDATRTENNSIAANTEGLVIGDSRTTGNEPWAGILDELRIANTVRSGEWVEAEHKSQNNQMNSFGSEESGTYTLSTPGIWQNRRKITFNNSQSSENLTNFPVRVSLSSSNIDYSKTQNSGQDIRFIDSDGTTVLKHEVETWNESGTSEAWVKVPQIDSGSTTDYVWMYYNNTTASSGQDAVNVWDSNFKGIWHLKEDPTGGAPQMQDSTSSNYDGTANGMEAGDQSTGQVNGSLAFDGTTAEYVDVGKQTNLYSATAYTASCWVKPTGSAGTRRFFFSDSDSTTAHLSFSFELDAANKPSTAVTTTGQSAIVAGTTTTSLDTWYHISATWSSSNTLTLYVNGASEGTPVNNSAAMPASSLVGNTAMGRLGSYTGGLNFPGLMDECRYSNTNRSAEWIEADYKTQNNQMNSFGSEEGDADFVPLAAADTAYTLTSDGEAFRLRMLLHVANNDLPTGSVNFKLQYAQKSGTCDTGYSGESYGDVGTASGDIRYKDLSGETDGAAMVADSDDPTHSGHTVVAQTHEEANNFTSISRVNRGQDGKWEFALVDFSAASGNSYCFRVVKSDGSTIATPGVVPEIAMASGNTAPSNPASLAQKKTNDTVLATGDWTNETSVKFTANVSDPDASDTLQLCVEKDLLGTGFSNTEDSCGTGVAYSGSAVAASVTISSIADASEYHWQARVKDAGGLYSSWVSYDVNAESARDFGVDTTAATGGTVYDGTTAGVDKTFSDTSLSSLSANWSGFNFNVSGILKYEYSIGTTPGATDTKTWTDNTTNTSVTATGLTLQTSRIYYFNVRATDNAGNAVIRSSDGQLVAPSLSFSVSPASITFNNLNVGNSYSDTEETTTTVSTNAYGGYVVRAFASDFLRSPGNFTVGSFTGGTYALPDSWQSGDTGFGYTSSDTDIQGSNKFQVNPCPGGSALASPGCYAPFTQGQPGDIIADHTGNVTGSPITNESFTITLRATVAALQQATRYQANLMYAATPIY